MKFQKSEDVRRDKLVMIGGNVSDNKKQQLAIVKTIIMVVVVITTMADIMVVTMVAMEVEVIIEEV